MNKIFISIFIFIIFLFSQVIKLNANDDTYINSSNIIYNEEENIIELAKNSKINFKNTNILIDRGVIDYNKNEFEVFGNFYLYEDLTILSGQNFKGDTSLNNFTADNVSYIYNNDLKIDADELERKNNLLKFNNNFLTPCELEGFFNCPTWSLRIDKSQYDVEKDKFTHFDTFLQIADYKIFYLPYFSHYGGKASRKKGFLTPTIQFTIGGSQGIITPYYIPISQSTEILLKPKFFLNENFEFLEQYELDTTISNKNTGGTSIVNIKNIKNENNKNINNTIKIETKQVLNRNNIISASGSFTNSVSTTRSINEDPITFEDIYLRLENYNLINQDDYLKTELSSVKSFDSTDLNSIPVVPSLNYSNFTNYKNNTIINELDFLILKRDKSTIDNPSESFKLNTNTEFINFYNKKRISSYNKLSWNNSLNDYYFNNDETLNHNSFKSQVFISSDLNFKDFKYLKPRTKFIIPLEISNSNKNINEDSDSITFNYQNQFSENRFFGNDLSDTSPRVIYGFEYEIKTSHKKFEFNVNQSIEANSNSNFASKINQESKFSDYAIEAKMNLQKFLFKIDSRLNYTDLSKKEMNYSLETDHPINLILNYNETQKEAFKNKSNDTQSIDINFTKQLSDYVNVDLTTNLDVKNNYDPYKSVFKISLFDECSQLDLNYTNTRYNDNFNTKPEETIGLTFRMEYLGFFGYEQSTNLFFTEPGNLNYGL